MDGSLDDLPSLDASPDAGRASEAGGHAEAESGAGDGGEHFRLVL